MPEHVPRQPRLHPFVISLLAIAAGVTAAAACTVPVFRYAMQMWRADAYEFTLFHNSDAPGATADVLRRLASDIEAPANVTVRTVDVHGDLQPRDSRLWRDGAHGLLPHLAAVMPSGALLWSGPAHTDSVRFLLDSPLRRQVTERLMAGEAGVWLLLRSGEAAADQQAAQVLAGTIQRFSEKGHPDSATAARLAPDARFSMLQLDRTAAREAPLVNMLLLSEPDLRELSGPMAFPVFGRGRVLYALVAAGINAPNILEACSFIAGECSCQAKALNPGIDLLLSAAWDRALAENGDIATPLTGFTTAPGSRGPAAPEARPGSFLVGTVAGRRVLWMVAIGLLVIAGATLVLMRRSAPR